MLPLCDRPGRSALLLSALVVVGAFAVFPFGCDAEYVVFDPVWYAVGAERDLAATTVKAHHPLFHLLVAGIAAPLDLAGVPRPGHIGTRLLSGLGAGMILLLLAGLAGRERWRVGAGLGLLLLTGRAWFLEAFTGENVLPAIAAGMAALFAALDERRSLVTVGLWTFVALLFRQDNVLLVPAIVLALHWRAAPPTLARLASWLAVVGGATAMAYVGIWAGLVWVGPDVGLLDWMWGIAKDDYSIAQRPVLVHGAAFGVAVAGKQWAASDPWSHVGVGAGALCLVLAFGALFRGDAGWGRMATLAAITAALRFAFYSWFEPTNAEWTLFTFAFAAAIAARAANGRPRTTPIVRRAAALGLTLAAVFTWGSHGSDTLSFRDHRYEPAGRWVAEHTRKGWRHFGYQNRGVLAVEMQGIPCSPLYTDFDRARQHLMDVVTNAPATPLLAVVDLAIQTGMPYDMRELERRWRGREPSDPPRARILWSKGGVYVVGFLVPR